MEKYFDKYAKITTKDNRKFNIKKLRIYIGGKKKYYGKKYIVIPDTKGFQDKVSFIDEIYSLDNNILRYLSSTYTKPIIINTIEHSIDNSEEKPITVIYDYEDASTEILSLSDIVDFESDLAVMNHKKIIPRDQLKEKKFKEKRGFILLKRKGDK